MLLVWYGKLGAYCLVLVYSFLRYYCTPLLKDPRCSFERLMIFLQNITQMMLNNPNINNQFKFHPQDGRFVEIWENRAMP
jgi:hypothetical protein